MTTPESDTHPATLAHHRPRLDPGQAAELARDLFGVEGTPHELPSERDQNFRITTADGDVRLLKIAHELEDPAVLDLQNRAMEAAHRGAPDLSIPQACPTRTGTDVATVDSPSGGRHLVRLLTWLPGVPLARVTPHPPELLEDLGRAVAELDSALIGFEHPAMGRELRWNVAQAPGVIHRYRDAVREPERRALLDRFLARFETALVPRLGELRRSVTHHDANDHNVLVDPALAGYRVCGLIDFGDLALSVTVADPAIAAAYAMLGKPAPLAAAARVVAGYHRVLSLEEVELDVLFDLICARLCTSVAISAFERREQPDLPYLTVTEAPAWELLEALAEIPPAFARARLRDACGLAPVPRGRVVVDWLERHRGTFAPVVDAAAEGPVEILDLSVASPELAQLAVDGGSPGAWGERLFDHLRRVGARAGVGRYDEARPFYAGALFEVPGEERPERRTIHLGVDLFVAAGTPVRAPLAGTLHSFADNGGALDYGPTVILRHEPEPEVVFYTLYAHLARASLDGLEPGVEIARGQVIAAVGAPDENGGWPPHVHFQLATDLCGRTGELAGVAPPSERAVWLALCPDPDPVLALPAPGVRAPRREDLLAARRAHLSDALSVSYRRPLTIVRGRGRELFDDVGRAYLDAVNNVPHVGHEHPHVVRAGQRQMAILNTNTRYLHEGLVRYAERLAATLPEPLEVCFFTCSGSEANELAVRLARAHTGARDIVVLEHGYHGNTTTLVDLSSYKFDGPGGAGAPDWVHTVAMPDPYRGPFRGDSSEVGREYADLVGRAVDELAASGRGPAAFLAEPLLGCGGQIVPPPGYLAAAYEHVRRRGGVCIADEVQVGFGRVGSHFWAFETQGVVPDVVTLGKPIANGHPMGAVVTTRAVAASFLTGMEYFNTFGGNPVSCAIANAVLDVIEDERLQENAQRTGARLMDGLRALQGRHPLIGDVRGLGLYVGVELVLDRETLEPAPAHAAYVVERMRDAGILLSTDGPLHDVLKIKPPLVFTEDDADRLCAALDEVLAETCLRVDRADATGRPAE